MRLLFCSFLFLQCVCMSEASCKPHVELPVVFYGERGINECVDAIVQGKYDLAIERFRYTLSHYDPSCRMFSIIRDGLESYGAIRYEDIEIECYGYTSESIQRLLSISDDALLTVFCAMHNFLKENKTFSFADAREYFDEVFVERKLSKTSTDSPATNM